MCACGPRKKLTEAAEFWAAGGPPAPPPPRIDEKMLLGLKRMGVRTQDIEAARARMLAHAEAQARAQEEDNTQFNVLPENWPVAQAFLAMTTQWEYRQVTVAVPMGPTRTLSWRKGLNYERVWAYLDGMVARRLRRRMFTELQRMEEAVLQWDARQREAQPDW